MKRTATLTLLTIGLTLALASQSWATGWTQQSPATSPTPRSHVWTAYDPAHHLTVLFGGYDGVKYLDDTWVWNGTGWMQKNPATSPSARYSAGMAYDSTHHRIIL